MGTRISPGFTIIEVMLFLAVTGLMVAGIMSSATGSLNAQRYRDGVESIRSAIAVEYDRVYSLTNSRDTADPCDPALTVRTWGTSECFYSGRLLEIVDGGAALKVSPVVAKVRDERESEMTARYSFEQVEGTSEPRAFNGGLLAVRPGGDEPTAMAILILRSPTDGAVVTYNLLTSALNSVPYNNLGASIDHPTSSNEPAQFCVADPDGPLDPGVRQAIVINKSATSAGDIETRMGDGDPEC